MPEDPKTLVRDTLCYMKDSLQAKPVIFATREECLFFQRKHEDKKSVPLAVQAPPNPIRAPGVFPEKVTSLKPAVKPLEPLLSPVVETVVKTQPPLAIERTSPVAEASLPIKKTLQKIAPHLKLIDQIPDDAEAKRIASAWKEKVSDAEVVLIACDAQPETLDLLKSLGKAIDQNLAKSKVISAERLEREKRWDLFLKQNAFRLIIVSDGMQSLKDLMRHYRSLPANAQSFLEETPVLSLPAAAVYKSLEQKAHLWKTLCQMLKK